MSDPHGPVPPSSDSRPASAGRINLQTLADELGLSRSTVSRALRGDRLIAVETRRRVKAAAERLGYRSNPYVSVLMSKLREGAPPGDSPVVAFLNPQATRDGWRRSRPLVVAVRAAAERARELGFQLQEFWLGEPGMTPERLAEILLTRGIRALILGVPGHPIKLVPFSTDGFAAVAIDLEPARVHLHRVTADYICNTTSALREMRALGYRRVGLAIDHDTLVHMHYLPRMAFLDFEESLPRAERAGYWVGPWDDVAGFARWMGEARPDGILSVNMSPQVWLQSLGFRIPQDIGVAQLDPGFVDFPHSGIDGHFEVVGRNAMDLLVAQINHHEFSPPRNPMHVMITGTWRPGATTCDRNAVPASNPYDELRLAICREAAQGRLDVLAELRRQFCKRYYAAPFSRTSRATESAWRCLSLTAAANTPFHVPVLPPSFVEKSEFSLPAGRRPWRGVPFDLPVSAGHGPNTVITLNTEADRIARKGGAHVRRLAVGAKIDALYFLHAAFFVWSPASVAQYRLIHADGQAHTVDLLPYWPSVNEAAVAAFQDSWRALPQFESESAKPVFALQRDDRNEARSLCGFECFFYVFELSNPRPEVVVHAVEFTCNPELETALVVAGITALLAR